MRHVIRLAALSTLALAFGTGVALCLPPALPAYAATPAPAEAAPAPATTPEASAEAPAQKKAKKVKTPLTGRLNLNTATVAELDRLPGIGPSKAARIVAARKVAPFERPAGLLRVKGIGRKTVKKLREYVKVEGESDLRGG